MMLIFFFFFYKLCFVCACAQNGKYEVPEWLQPEMVELLACMLQTDPRRRITIAQLLEHSWLNHGFNIPVEWASKYKVLCCCCSTPQLNGGHLV